MKKIMTLHINVLGVESVETPEVTMCQIRFDGDASGDYFNGKILPGGVDTQTIYKNAPNKLSARYILEGFDMEGNKCRMYIENNASTDEEFTHPTIITDSKALAFLKDSELAGKVVATKDNLFIEIYIL